MGPAAVVSDEEQLCLDFWEDEKAMAEVLRCFRKIVISFVLF